MKGKRTKISIRFRIYYTIAFFLGCASFLVLLSFNGWNLWMLPSSPTFSFLITISGSTMKFLGGFGIALTYASLGSLVFRMTSEQVRGKKRYATGIKILLLVPLLGILIYGGLKIYGAFTINHLTFLEVLITVYGVWSLLFSIYLLPIVRSTYDPEFDKGTLDRIKEKFRNLRFSLWKGYHSGIKHDYGTVYAAEFQKYNERLDLLRIQLSGVLLLPISIMLMLIPPLAFPILILSIRIFSLHQDPLTSLERGMLVLATVCILVLTTGIFLISDITTHLFFFDIAYGLGLILSGIGILILLRE